MPHNEAQRLDALRTLGILDTPPSESFDRITRMASHIFNLPIAAVSLTDADRQWFKSRVGVDHWEIPRDKAPCSEVAGCTDFVLIRDFQKSECYRESLLGQSGIRFYAGAPLVTREGHGLGALCVLGTEPRDITEQERAALTDLAAMVMAQIELQHAFGRIDPASGLPNRHQFLEDLQDMVRDHAGEWRAVVKIDLVDGSHLADLLRIAGPSFLDELIASSSRATRTVLSGTSLVYQTGPTQYAYISTMQDIDSVFTAAVKVREGLMAEARKEGMTFETVPVFGIAPFILGQTGPQDVLRMAHSAAQDARDGDVGVGVYSMSLDEAHHRRFSLLRDIASALEAEDELSLVYQPRIDLRSGTCLGAEALLRWRHPVLGPVSPGEFMPLVEKTTLARPATEWVVREALRQIAEWRQQGIDLVVSVNISASNLNEEDFAERVIAAVAAAGVPSSSLEIELTESAIIANGELAIAQLDRIAAAGMRIAIDDFGTGYSSLSYLERIPARVLKIDQSFMARLGQDPRSHTLVATMISLAHDLGYSVVAEGIETQDVYDFLTERGCDEGQGYLMSRPLPAADFVTWLAARKGQGQAQEELRLSA